MSDDASLTDFTGGGDDESDVDDVADERDASERSGAAGSSVDAEVTEDPQSADESEPTADAEPTEDSEPSETPTYTYTSTPDGAECDACGEVVDERWHAGEGGTAAEPDLSPDALVCPDCKEW